MQIIALLACHNRRVKTLECLSALFEGNLPETVGLQAVLVDDGSSDGTADAVKAAYPLVTVAHGDGTLFWNRGMHRAQSVAVQSRPDFLLWLNDDTILVPNALDNLLSAYECARREGGPDVVIVGATVDPSTNALTYGGLRSRSRLRRFNFIKLPLVPEVQECQAMNGNIVLVPRAIYERVGALDPVFEHALGDIDYALRVRSAGFPVFVAPGFQGTCSANKAQRTHLDSSLPMGERWKRFVSRKGLPPTSWRHFVRRHAGRAWLFYFIYPYINFALRITRDGVLRGENGRRDFQG